MRCAVCSMQLEEEAAVGLLIRRIACSQHMQQAASHVRVVLKRYST